MKREVKFSYDTSQTFVTHRDYNQSVVVKRLSIQSDITPNSNIHRYKLLREFQRTILKERKVARASSKYVLGDAN